MCQPPNFSIDINNYLIWYLYQIVIAAYIEYLIFFVLYFMLVRIREF